MVFTLTFGEAGLPLWTQSAYLAHNRLYLQIIDVYKRQGLSLTFNATGMLPYHPLLWIHSFGKQFMPEYYPRDVYKRQVIGKTTSYRQAIEHTPFGNQ